MVELSQKGAAVIDYPASQISWSVPQAEDEEYEQAYNKDVDGNVVYNSNMSVDERAQAACKAALGYLKKAGFKVKKGVITEVPENTRKKYIIYIPIFQESHEIFFTCIIYSVHIAVIFLFKYF